ncbi:SPOR domain-containing protein [Persephonella sp.]|uniref:SPOR domain-containing protein n=1 Tax=Persephonella sp. TaxID=2060922 RepID=UPI00260BB601|nr:SPOR domain-containing protein [Persephonella sp.]
MLSKIYGQQKKDIYLLIFNLLKDSNVFGILYGKKGIGKKYVVTSAINNLSSSFDKKIFIEATPLWKNEILSTLGIEADAEISKEEFLIKLIDFLEGFDGRVFIVINNAQNLTEKELSELAHLLNIKEKLSVFVIGTSQLKEKLNPFKIGKIEGSINFILEVEPPEFEEFKKYFTDKYGSQIEEKALKILYKMTDGSIEEAENTILRIGKFPIEPKDLGYKPDFLKPVLLGVAIFTIIGVISYGIYYGWSYFNSPKEEEIVEKIKKLDKKLPEEGIITEGLPIKPKPKKHKKPVIKKIEFNEEDIIQEINRQLDNLSFDIPEVKFYQPVYNYLVQVAAFRNFDNAKKFADSLKKEFPDITVIKTKKGLSLVVIKAENKEKAVKIKNRLKKYKLSAVIKRIRK